MSLIKVMFQEIGVVISTNLITSAFAPKLLISCQICVHIYVANSYDLSRESSFFTMIEKNTERHEQLSEN